jgi:hypothetical protein
LPLKVDETQSDDEDVGDLPEFPGTIYAGDYIKRQSMSMPHLWPQVINPLARNDSTVINEFADIYSYISNMTFMLHIYM